MFPPGVTSLEVSFTVLDDDVVEDTELVQLVLVGGPGERGVQFPEGGIVSGTILDDNDTVQIMFDPSSYDVEEEVGVVTVQLRKEGVNERDLSVVVMVDTSNTMAIDGVDFNLTLSPRVVTFSPSDVTRDFSFLVYQEGIYEAVEGVSLFLEPFDGETAVVVPGRGRVFIADSDTVTLGFETSLYTVLESSLALNVTVVLLEGVLDTDVNVQVSVFQDANDLAIKERDYSLASTTLTFVVGGPEVVSFMVDLMDDDFFEGREDFTLMLQTDQSRVLFSPASTVVSIVDNEDLNVQFQNATYTVGESNSSLNVVVILVASIERDITLELLTVDGRATAGSDYEQVSETLTFTPTSASSQLQINLLDDLASEGLEEFFLRVILSDKMLGIPGLLTEATVFILDNENIFISFASSSFSAREDEGAVFLEIRKSGETQADVDIIVSLSDGTARGGIDYGPFPAPELNFTATVLSSDTAIFFGVVLRDDNIVEMMEGFRATLYIPTTTVGNVFIEGPPRVEVFIVDNDVINITLLPEVVQVGEDEGYVSFDIIRTDDSLVDSNLSLVVIATAVSDSAIGGLDYVEVNVGFEFSDDSPMNFTFNATILDDEIVEGMESFIVVLSVPENIAQHVVFHSQELLVQILDEDVVTVSVESPLYEVIESSSVATICLRKDAETGRPLPVVMQPLEITPTLPDVFQARAFQDFDPSPINAAFQTRQEVLCVDIPIIDDGMAGESREVFAVSFSIPEIGLSVITSQLSMATVMINDIPDVNFGFVRASTETRESLGGVEVCIGIFNPSSDEELDTSLVVELETVPVTADSSDYVLVTPTLILGNLTRRACTQVVIINDNEFEDSLETLEIVISNFSLSDEDLVGFSSVSTTQVVIRDDDRFAVVGFGENFTRVSVRESAGSAVLCVEVLAPESGMEFSSEIEIVVGTRPGTADSRDYVFIRSLEEDLVIQLNSLNRNDCFEVDITDDNTFEGDDPETFEVQLVVRTTGMVDLDGISANPSVAVVSIVDDDSVVEVGFEETMLRVNETAVSVEVCVGLLGTASPEGEELGVEFDVRVLLDEDESTADFQIDFELDRDLLLGFNNSRRRQCFDVEIINDEMFETDVPEIIVLQLLLVVGSPLGVAIAANASSAEILVFDNDELPSTTTTLEPTELTTTPPPQTTTTTDSTPVVTMPTIILANDTVVGDPLYSVPMSLVQALPPEVGGSVPHLCFEIHGEPETHFNLLSDNCTSVNALYSAVSSDDPIGFHIISRIGISAVDSAGECVFVQVGVENDCTPIIRSFDSDGDGELDAVETMIYNSLGVSVRKRRNIVRVSVPNCGIQRLVMYASCEESGDTPMNTPMIRFDITRGINLNPTSHGLIGQFWNVPISLQPYEYSGAPTVLDIDSLFSVCISHPSDSSRDRKFIAEYFTRKWDLSLDTCFYSGNVQGGRLLEIQDPDFNDPVIEGEYTEYIVNGLFKNSFRYSQYSGCDLP